MLFSVVYNHNHISDIIFHDINFFSVWTKKIIASCIYWYTINMIFHTSLIPASVVPESGDLYRVSFWKSIYRSVVVCEYIIPIHKTAIWWIWDIQGWQRILYQSWISPMQPKFCVCVCVCRHACVCVRVVPNC